MKNFFIKESVSDCNAAAAAATMREWCKSQDENWLAKKVITPPEQLQKDRLSGNRFSDAIFAQQSINELMNDASSSSLHCCGQTRVVQKKLLFLGSTGTVKVGTTKVCSSFKMYIRYFHFGCPKKSLLVNSRAKVLILKTIFIEPTTSLKECAPFMATHSREIPVFPTPGLNCDVWKNLSVYFYFKVHPFASRTWRCPRKMANQMPDMVTKASPIHNCPSVCGYMQYQY